MLVEWTNNPKLAKMMPAAVRKKAVVPMVPRSTLTKAKPAAKTADKPKAQTTIQAPKSQATPNENPLSLVSAAYAPDTSQAMEVEEEYDPAHPNEYDHFVSERAQRLKEEKEAEESSMDRDIEMPAPMERDDGPPKVRQYPNRSKFEFPPAPPPPPPIFWFTICL